MIYFPFNYNGTEYRSLLAFCKGEGLPYGRTMARLRAGRPLSDLFYEGHLGKSSRRGGFDLGRHPSVQAMAEASGLKYSTVYNRLKAGRSVEDAVDPKMIRRRPASQEIHGNEVEYGGKVYPALSLAARAAGLPPVTVYQRWHRGKRGPDLFAPIIPVGMAAARRKLTDGQLPEGESEHVCT